MDTVDFLEIPFSDLIKIFNHYKSLLDSLSKIRPLDCYECDFYFLDE